MYDTDVASARPLEISSLDTFFYSLEAQDRLITHLFIRITIMEDLLSEG